MKRSMGWVYAALLVSAIALPARAQEPAPPAETLKDAFPARKAYSPYAGRNFPTRVFWGDTHLHTSASLDAGAFGTRLDYETAYRFARGEELTASAGLQVKLSRPLDFLAITDHSDNMGFFPALFAGKPEMLADPDRQALVRPGPGRRGERRQGGSRDHRPVLAGHVPGGAQVPARIPGLPRRLGQDHQDRGEVQRPRPLHRLHRLRVDLAGPARQQPAPRRDLPRRRGQGEPDRALHDLPAAGQHDARGPVEGAAGLRGQDRRAAPGHRPQREPEQRLDVPVRDQPDLEAAAHPRVRRRPAPAGSRSTRPPRSRATGKRTRSSRPTTRWSASSCGTRATST